MPRLKSMVALVLALIWLPAGSLCLIESTALMEQGDCCSESGERPAPVKSVCDEPCGILASGNYLLQQAHWVLPAPVGEIATDWFSVILENQPLAGVTPGGPATAPPELITCWQFSFRMALSPRAPSLLS